MLTSCGRAVGMMAGTRCSGPRNAIRLRCCCCWRISRERSLAALPGIASVPSLTCSSISVTGTCSSRTYRSPMNSPFFDRACAGAGTQAQRAASQRVHFGYPILNACPRSVPRAHPQRLLLVLELGEGLREEYVEGYWRCCGCPAVRLDDPCKLCSPGRWAGRLAQRRSARTGCGSP